LVSKSVGNPKKGPGDARPILVATDFSADADAALVWASRHAARIGAPLHVLHVVHDPAEASGFYRKGRRDGSETMAEAAEKMMASHIAKAREAHPELAALQSAKPELVSGLASGRIVEVAKRDGAQLIVVGSRGRTGLSHLLIGSVAERVAQLAPMPVVIVKPEAG
jgi:nucleotide-binding universal stress UspA family protein